MRPTYRPYRKPTTLRDVQRGMAHGQARGWLDVALNKLGLPFAQTYEERYQIYLPMINRLVAQYGPNALVRDLEKDAQLTSGDERKKETDEIAPATSQTSNEKHGGDGASGEVPDGQSTKGDADADSRQVGDQALPQQDDRLTSKGGSGGSQELEKHTGQGTADHSEYLADRETVRRIEETGHQQATPQTSKAQEVQGPAVAQDSADSYQHTNGDERETAKDIKKDASNASAVAGNDASSADQTIRKDDTAPQEPKQVGEAPRREDTSEIPSSRTLLKALKKAEGKVSRRGKAAHGGVFDALARHKIERRVVTQARAVLTSWLSDGADDEQSQRWDYPELAARLLTRRDLRPAKRYEYGRPALLILADVSGSCAGFSNQSLVVAKAIASLGLPGCATVVIAHSNGAPQHCEINGKPMPHAHQERLFGTLAHARYGMEFVKASVVCYQHLLAEHQITHVLAIGDHDAVGVYEALALDANVQQVVWLDNYNCNNQPPRLCTPSVVHAQAKQTIRYVVGCSDAADFVRGLRVALD